MVSLKSFKLIGEVDGCGDNQQMMPTVLPLSSSSSSNKLMQDQLVIESDTAPANQESSTTVVSNSNSREDRQLTGRRFRQHPTAMSNSGKSIVTVSLPTKDDADDDKPTTVQPDGLSTKSSASSISIVVVGHQSDGQQAMQPPEATPTSSTVDFTPDDDLSQPSSLINEPAEHHQMKVPLDDANNYFHHLNASKDLTSKRSPMIIEDGLNMYMSAKQRQQAGQPARPRKQLINNNTTGEHFEIVWSNLSYKIEPKWYKKINFLDQVFSHFLPGQTIDSHSSATSTASSSAGMQDNQHQMHFNDMKLQGQQAHQQSGANSANVKPSLDSIEIFTNLNGTIKSGQMTAVLGPSGKYIIIIVIRN